MIALALACREPPPDEVPFVALIPGPQVWVEPAPRAQTHPSLGHDGERWLVAWDEDGVLPTAAARWLSGDGEPMGERITLALAQDAGFVTPDVVMGKDGDWYVILRVDQQVELARYRDTEELARVEVGTGELGFWTAPDLALADEQLVVGWWDGDREGAADYRVRRLDLALEPIDEAITLASSPGPGSPVALEPHPDGGWQMAWSDGTIQLLHADETGEILSSSRVDDHELPWPPSRPALAGRAVGWRAQDELQNGAGTRLRLPPGPSVELGLDPSSTNRLELDTLGDWLVATWEESSNEGDVVLQVFDLQGQPQTGPVRAHDALQGYQGRPTVELAQGPQGLVIGLAFEDDSPGQPAIALRTFAWVEN